MQNLSAIVMGLTAILLQVTALRELVSVFSGNELDIGVTLSVWLAAVGMGSYAGRRIRLRNAFALSFFAVGLLSQPSLLLIHLIRPVLSVELGETIPLAVTIMSTVLSLAPVCLVIGAQFPLAVSYLRGKTATVYSLEAVGAFAGGVLFTVALSGRVNALTLTAAVSAMNIVMAAVLLRKKVFIPALAIPILFSFGNSQIDSLFRRSDVEIIERAESRYGVIKVLKIRNQFNVYSSGKFQFSYPDPQTEELRAHLPLVLHPAPNRVLIIGGSPVVVRECLKYSASGIDFIEIDPEMIRVSLRLLRKEGQDTLNDKRLEIRTVDARKFIKTVNARYDLIVLNLPEPSTANINRFYTVEFFREVRKALNQDGMIVLSLPTSSGYVGKRMQMANGSIYNSLRNVFRHVEASSEEYGILAASDGVITIDPDSLHDRFVKRKIAARHFHPYILNDAFSPLKVSMVKGRLEKVDALNTDMRPAAYLYNLMVWAEMQRGALLMALPEYGGGFVLAALAAAIIVAAFLWRKKQGVYYSIFITGYSAMAFSIVIILAYQAVFGYVYEMIGLLTAAFMAGIAAGAYGIRVSERPLWQLRTIGAATILLLVSSPLFFKHEVLYYLLSFFIGIAGGAEFATANQLMKEHDAIGIAGRLYAVDLAGSFLGAMLTAIILVPLFGIQNAVLFVAVLKAASLALLFSIRYESS